MKFKNVVTCDLRKYNSVKAASEIESVTNAALVILPQEADDATRAAFAKIEMHNVAATIYADSNAKISTFNGELTLDDACLPDGETVIYSVNGDVTVLPLSEGKHVCLLVNGILRNDKSNGGKVEILSLNGEMKLFDFQDTKILAPQAVLPASCFSGNGKNRYYAKSVAVIEPVEKDAHGEVCAQLIIADESVRASRIQLEGKQVLFADTRENQILLRSALSSFTVSKSLLESVEGKLVLCDITQVKISKDVTPELLREKVLAFFAIVSIKATKKTFDEVQLLAHDVTKIQK